MLLQIISQFEVISQFKGAKARAKARAAYAKREIGIKAEKARLKATLDALQEEKEKNAYFAEAEILEAALQEVDLGLAGRVSPPIPCQKSLQHTLDHASLSSSQQFNRVRDEKPLDSADTDTSDNMPCATNQMQTDEQLTPGHTILASTSKANNQRNGGIQEGSHQHSYSFPWDPVQSLYSR